ncbi:MAG: tyrosine-type recombinase/integrase [Lachnospiraceae bacterium]
MARKKKEKHEKLPNGFGSIKKLSGNRRNPYAVYPPVTEYIDNGDKVVPVIPKALTYVDSWLKGVGVLSAFHSGTYVPGQELPDYLDSANSQDVVQGILRHFNASQRTKANEPPQDTFETVYKAYYKWKYEADKSKEYSDQSKASTRAAFKKFKTLHNKAFCGLTHADFQSVIDECNLGFSSKTNLIILVRGMSEYAYIYKIITADESKYLKAKIQNDAEEGSPFSDEELKLLWDNQNNETVEMLLIMCYSGYRVAAYQNIHIDLEGKYFRGGVKNKYSKNRIVPIHSGILPLVEKRLHRDGTLLNMPYQTFNASITRALHDLGINRRTPHDCRHTFSRLCERDKVNENDRKRMLGHSFGSDITNKVYGHRSVEELRVEIEKIQICY